MRHLQSRSAFTLIETILYIGLTAMVVVSLTRIMLTVTGTREKTSTLHTVQQEARFVLDRITHASRNALSVNTGSSIFDSSTGSLVLVMSGADVNPTTFYLSGTGVYVQEASGAATKLNSENVEFTRLEFRDRTAENSYGTIKVVLRAADAVTGNQDNTYIDDLTLETSITLRQ